MKIGYGTYAMQTENIFDALPRLRDIGYEALEINTGDDWPTAPHKLDNDTRETLAKTIQDLGFESPVTMALMPICTQDDGRPAILEKFDSACILASDLAFGDAPGIIVSTLGGLHGTWDEVKPHLLRSTHRIGRPRRQTQRHPRNRTPCGPPARHPPKS